jgi:hypothetical protein
MTGASDDRAFEDGLVVKIGVVVGNHCRRNVAG